MTNDWKHYSLLPIVHQPLNEEESEKVLWYQSNKIMDLHACEGHEDILTFLEYWLPDNIDFYVFDDIRTYKGKKVVKAGQIVVARKAAILDFVREDLDEHGYSTPLRIMPRIGASYVIKISEGDGVFIFRKKTSYQHLIIHDLRISAGEIYVGVTDGARWYNDINSGQSGANAMTLTAIILTETDHGRTEETADLTATVDSEFRNLIYASLPNISKIAWDIKNEGLDFNAAKNKYFGVRIKQY